MDKSEEKVPEARLLCSVRLLISVLGFFGFMCMNAQRTAIGVAIVCMVNHTAVQQLQNERLSEIDIVHTNGLNDSSGQNISLSVNYKANGEDEDQCSNTQLSVNGSDSDKSSQDGEFVWTKQMQGIILGSFFYGYMISQIPAGWLAGRIGGRKVFGGFMILVSLSSLLTPMAARIDYKFLVALRILAGFGSGVTYPAMHAMWGQWAPPLERSRLAGISYAGSQLGNVIGLVLSGFLCEYGFDGGWPSIFYILGAGGAVWSIVWLIVVADSPEEAKRISPEEREYILSSLQGQKADHVKHKPGIREIPWLSMITSLPVWAIIVGNLCGDFGLYTFETCLPTYMKEVLNFDIQSNGIFSAMPFVAFWAMILTASVLADKLRTSGLLTTANARKLCEAIGMIVPATLLVAVGFLDCTQWQVAISMLIVGVGMSGFQWSGYLVNHVDIAPEYAGILMGISNCIACLSGVIGPAMVGALTVNQTRGSWQIVFFIIAAVLLFGCVFFGLFAQGELQPWAAQRKRSIDDVETKDGEGDKMLEEMSATNGQLKKSESNGHKPSTDEKDDIKV